MQPPHTDYLGKTATQQSYFGTVTVTGTVDVSQVTLTDTCQFYYGYQLNLQRITINNGVYDSTA